MPTKDEALIDLCRGFEALGLAAKSAGERLAQYWLRIAKARKGQG